MSFMVLARLSREGPETGGCWVSYLTVQPGGHSDDIARLAVYGEHVGDGAQRGLGQNSVAHHPIGRGVIISIVSRHFHHIGA